MTGTHTRSPTVSSFSGTVTVVDWLLELVLSELVMLEEGFLLGSFMLDVLELVSDALELVVVVSFELELS